MGARGGKQMKVMMAELIVFVVRPQYTLCLRNAQAVWVKGEKGSRSCA
jgi:hypothetical protein